MAHGLEAIDWHAPWLQPWRDVGQTVARGVEHGRSVAQALNAACEAQGANALHGTQPANMPLWDRCPKRFVPQSDLPAPVAYEQFIFDTHRVPTRDGLHDFFNGLAWLHFPRTKVRLNELQAQQIALSGIAPVRGPARDALTLFDENAALLQAPDALWQALVAKDWPRLFGDLRPLWQSAQLILFGHALLEKLVTPRKAITAHVYRLLCPGRSVNEVDTWLAHTLSAGALAAKPFAHLPVLGVPGWWAENTYPAFYADTGVFRPGRKSTN